MTNEQLAVEIASHNRVNQLIKDYAPAILANAKALEGRPIFKADGSLRKDAIKTLDLPTLPGRSDMIYLNRSTYSLGFTFKTCCTAKNSQPHMSDHCSYSESTVYIGDMADGVLGEVKQELVNEHRSDYTLEEVVALRAKCAEARKAYEEARSACNPFGER